MLRSMRKHGSKWVLGFLVVIISVVFVFTFGFNNRGEADRTLAEVGSHRITAMEYQQAYNKAIDFYRQSSGGKFDEAQANQLKETVMNQLVDKYVLLKKAREMGIAVTDREFAEDLGAMGAFNRNGKFDRGLYLQFLANNNLDPKTFEEDQKQAMLISRVVSIIQDNGAASGMDEKGAYEAYLRAKGQVKLSYAVFDPDQYKDKIVVDDKELSDLYEKDKAVYRSENTFHLRYMVIDEKGSVRDDQAYMDLLKSKDLAAYGTSKGLDVVDLGTLKESDVLSRFSNLKIREALKGLGKGDITLPLRVEGRSYIFQVMDQDEGKPLEKAEALKIIRARVVAERSATMAEGKAEDAVRDKGMKFTRDTVFIQRNSASIPGIGVLPKESAGLLGLAKGQVFQRPVEVDGKFYVFAFADEKQPDKEQWDKDKAMFIQVYTAMARNAYFAAFKEDLRADMKVKIDWKDI